MEGISYLLLLPIVSNLMLGGIVFRRDIRDKTFQLFFILSALVTLWGVITLMYIDYQSLVLARLSFALGIWILTAMVFFARSYPKKQKLSSAWRAIILSVSLLVSILSLTDAVLATFPRVVFGPLLLIYVVYFFALFAATLYTFISQFRKASGHARHVLLFVVLSCCLSILWGTVFDLIVPIVRGDTAYNRLGVLTAPFLTVGIAYTIIRHRLFNVQLQAQRLLNVVLPVSVTVALAVASGLLLKRAGLLLQPLGATLLLVGTIVLYEALRSLFTKTWVGYLLFRPTYRFHERLKQMAASVAAFSELDQLAAEIEHAFMASGNVSGWGLLIVNNQRERAWVPHEVSTFDLAHLTAFNDPEIHAQLFDYLVETAAVLAVDELPYRRPRVAPELTAALTEVAGGVCLPLLVGSELTGVIVLGAKTRHRAYTSEDIAVFRCISPALAIALTKAKLVSDYAYRTKRLELDKNNLEVSVKELRRIKSTFLDIVDHQFNTPLSIIKSTIAMIREGDVQLSEVKQFLDMAAPRIDEFDQIIRGMLTAAHLDGTRAELKFAPLDVNAVVASVIEQLKPLAAERHVVVRFDAAPELPRTLSDPELFQDAVQQLVKNALFYGREGAVSVQTQKQHDHVAIVILDAGRGFDADEAAHIGEKFYRGPHVADYLANGSGLGVFIAKRVVEASGGTLTWHSDGLGKGAEFVVEVPRATVSVAQAVST